MFVNSYILSRKQHFAVDKATKKRKCILVANIAKRNIFPNATFSPLDFKVIINFNLDNYLPKTLLSITLLTKSHTYVVHKVV